MKRDFFQGHAAPKLLGQHSEAWWDSQGCPCAGSGAGFDDTDGSIPTQDILL